MFKKILMMSIIGLIAATLAVTNASSQETYDIKTMTPEVEQALMSRRDRYDHIVELKNQGAIGENNKGYVEALKENEEVQAVVDAENKDRGVIYKTIADQNDLMDALSTIEKVFAQVQREKAEPGEMIQLDDGSWIKKDLQ